MSRWREASTWTGDGVRREVFFFRSRGVELYGSLYAAAEPTRPLGVVACNSWGVEADRTEPLQRAVVLTMARGGGGGLLFHYPGYGDSFGDPAGVSLGDLGEAACDAVGEASRRCPGLDWILGGFMLGASVAALAQREAGVDELLLVQPALRPAAYFQRLTESRRPLAPGPGKSRAMIEIGRTPGMAYGYPVPRRIAEQGEEGNAAVVEALAAFRGRATAIRHPSSGEEGALPPRFEEIEVPGSWRFGMLEDAELNKAVNRWLQRRIGALGDATVSKAALD